MGFEPNTVVTAVIQFVCSLFLFLQVETQHFEMRNEIDNDLDLALHLSMSFPFVYILSLISFCKENDYQYACYFVLTMQALFAIQRTKTSSFMTVFHIHYTDRDERKYFCQQRRQYVYQCKHIVIQIFSHCYCISHTRCIVIINI